MGLSTYLVQMNQRGRKYKVHNIINLQPYNDRKLRSDGGNMQNAYSQKNEVEPNARGNKVRMNIICISQNGDVACMRDEVATNGYSGKYYRNGRKLKTGLNLNDWCASKEKWREKGRSGGSMVM